MDLCCASCHEVIGAYEPMWVILNDSSERAGSRLTLALELSEPGSIAVHDQCHSTADGL